MSPRKPPLILPGFGSKSKAQSHLRSLPEASETDHGSPLALMEADDSSGGILGACRASRNCFAFPFLGAAWVIFLILAAYQLGLPGPHYDEAVEVVPSIQMLRNLPVTAYRGAGIHLAGHLFPVMSVDYIGSLNTYLVIPFFLVGGIGVPSMRMMPIVGGLIAIYFAYRLASEWAGREAGVATAFFLAVQPSFVFWTRQGIFVTSITTPILMAFLWCLWRWWTRGGRQYLFLAAFLAGLGIYAKFLFVWPLLGTAVLAAFAWRFRPIHCPSWRKDLLGGVAAFFFGLWPFILFNLQTGGTLKHFTRHLSDSYYGVHNAAYLHNLAVRIEEFRSLLAGDHFWYLGGIHRDPWMLPAFLLAPALAWLALRSRKTAWLVGAPLALIALVVIQSPFTPSALWVTHYAILTPLVAFSLGVSIGTLMHAARSRWATAALILLVLALWGRELSVDVAYHRSLAQSGGLGDHSDAIYHLEYWLETHGKKEPLALDWGISAPVFLLSRGDIAPKELFGYENLQAGDAALQARIAPHIRDERQVYLLHTPEATVFKGRREVLDRMARADGKSLVQAAVFPERSGRPLLEVVQVK